MDAPGREGHAGNEHAARWAFVLLGVDAIVIRGAIALLLVRRLRPRP